MASCGLDRVTGEPLYDLDHVAQALETIFVTRLGEMITLEWFGGGLVALLGRRVTPRLIDLYRVLLVLAIATWEPRLKVLKITFASASASELELGRLTFSVVVLYRPRGHLGDFTVEGAPRTLLIGANDNRLIVSVAA